MTQTKFWENIEQFKDMTFIGNDGEVKSNMAIINHKCSYLGKLTEHLFIYGGDINISVPDSSTRTIRHAIEKLYKEDDDQAISELCGIKHPFSNHEPVGTNGWPIIKLEAIELELSEFKHYIQNPTIGPEKEFKKEELDEDVENKISKVNKRFECSECGLKFTTSNYMRSHIDAIHKGAEFSCSQCDYKNPYKGNLRNHMNLKHTVLPKYYCTVRGKEFKVKRRL